MNRETIMKFKSRKILLLGRAYYASIPRMWLDSNNLDKGSKVDIFLQDDGSLLIKPWKEELP